MDLRSAIQNLNSLTAYINQEHKTLSKTETAKKAAESKVTELDKKLVAAQARYNKLQGYFKELTAADKQNVASLKHAEQESKELRRDLQDVQEKLILVESQFSEAERKARAAEQQIQGSEQQLKDTEQELISAQQKTSRLETQNANLHALTAELEMQKVSLVTAKVELDRKNSELERKLAELEHKDAALEQDKSVLQNKLTELERENTDMKICNAALQNPASQSVEVCKEVVRKLFQTTGFGNWVVSLTDGIRTVGRNELLDELMMTCLEMKLRKRVLGWDPECELRSTLQLQSQLKAVPEFEFLSALDTLPQPLTVDSVGSLTVDYDPDLDKDFGTVSTEWDCPDENVPFIVPTPSVVPVSRTTTSTQTLPEDELPKTSKAS